MREDVCDDWFRPPPGDAPALSDVRDCLAIGAAGALRRAVDLLPMPPIASGTTGERFRLLAEIAAIDLSLGRLFEGHCDALDIVRQADLEPKDGVYGVWAAATDLLTATGSGEDARLSGSKPYSSGAPFLQRALVTAAGPGGPWLFEIDVTIGSALRLVPGTWPSVGMAASESYTVELDRAPVARPVGESAFYTRRPGFWQGSLNVAACWFGGALGLARGVLPILERDEDAHRWADFGALAAEVESMQRVLDAAARATDRDPLDAAGRARERALGVRHCVYAGANRVLELAARIGGTGGFTQDPAQSRRLADLPIYLRQHHPGPDLETLGRMTFARFADG